MTRSHGLENFPAGLGPCLLPLPAAASPGPTRGGARSIRVRLAGRDVDLPVLDFAASFGGQLFDLLLRLQIKHHVSELLLQLGYYHVLSVRCSR